MRYLLIGLIIILLAGCGGGEPTEVVQNTDALPTVFVPEGTQVGIVEVSSENAPAIETLIAEEIAAQNPQPFVPPTLAATLEEGALPAPLVGTLVASVTEDPQAGRIFDYIYMTQTGGSENVQIVVEIYGDGRAKYNDKEGRISQDAINQIVVLMDELNYFGLVGTFIGPAPRPNEYTYQIYIQRGGIDRLINAQDGYIPVEFTGLLSLVRNSAETIVTGNTEATPELTPSS